MTQTSGILRWMTAILRLRPREYLKTGSDRAIVRNVHRSRDKIVDEHIAIRGCFLYGNKKGKKYESSSVIFDEFHGRRADKSMHV